MVKHSPALPDAAGRQLEIDDIVMTTYGGYTSMIAMTVVGFTPKQIRLKTNQTLYASSGRSGMVRAGETVTRHPGDVILVQAHNDRPLGRVAISPTR